MTYTPLRMSLGVSLRKVGEGEGGGGGGGDGSGGCWGGSFTCGGSDGGGNDGGGGGGSGGRRSLSLFLSLDTQDCLLGRQPTNKRPLSLSLSPLPCCWNVKQPTNKQHPPPLPSLLLHTFFPLAGDAETNCTDDAPRLKGKGGGEVGGAAEWGQDGSG